MINIDKKDSLVSIKIIEPKGERQLKYMATVKEYYDELNGNSYWSCRVEDIEEDKFTEMVSTLKEVDISKVVELFDNTDLTGELACAGGACEITESTAIAAG